MILFLAIAFVSISAPLIRWAADAPPLMVASSRVCLAAMLLAVVAGRSLAALGKLPARERRLIVLAGLLLGAHFGVWISSLYFTSTAASVTLVATQPVFAAIFGLVLGDRVGTRAWFGIAVASLGCALLAGGDWQVGRTALIGDGLALAGAATAAAYLVVGRRLREALPLFPYLAAVNAVAGISLLSVALATGVRFDGHGNHVYLAIVACAVGPSLLGHTLLNVAVRRMPAHLVSLAILGEPIGASALVWMFLDEKPPSHAVLGGLVILFGIAVGFLRFGGGRRSAPRADSSR